MIEIGSLRALAAIEQHGSVIAASETMGFSPSAVSQQIKKLEKQTGFAVLERRGRGVLLTERGLTLAAYGRRILSELEELESTLLSDPCCSMAASARSEPMSIMKQIYMMMR